MSRINPLLQRRCYLRCCSQQTRQSPVIPRWKHSLWTFYHSIYHIFPIVLIAIGIFLFYFPNMTVFHHQLFLSSIFLSLPFPTAHTFRGVSFIPKGSPRFKILAPLAPFNLEFGLANDPNSDITRRAQALVLSWDYVQRRWICVFIIIGTRITPGKVCGRRFTLSGSTASGGG